MTCPILTLLIVEDFPPDRERYQHFLSADPSCVYRFIKAESAIAGLEICRTQTLDAILLKDGLPDATGLEFLKALNAQSVGEMPPVVIVADETAAAEGDETVSVAVQRVVQAIKLGAENYLIKHHLTSEQLQAAMQSAIENRRLHSQQQVEIQRLNQELDRRLKEWRQAEIALQEQTKLLQKIVESIGDGLIWANSQGEFVLFNQAAERIFGPLTNERPCQEWSSTYGLFLPDQQTLFPNQDLPLARAMRGEVANNVEVFVQRDRASAGRWISISGYPVLDRDNGITGGVVTCRDITERKRAESDLQTQRQLLESIVNYLPNSVAIVRGHDLTFQLVNPAYQAIAPGKQMVGRPIREVWSEMQPAFFDRCRHVLETGAPHYAIDEAFQISRAEGGLPELAYFSWSMHRLNLPGEDGAGILITIAETSDRKRAELLLSQTLQKLNFHIENSPLAVVEWDHDFRVSRWSSAAERVFGWRPEDVLGKSFGDWRFVFDEDLERVQHLGQRLAQGIEQRNVFYNRNYTQSGEIVYCEWYNSTLVDASGRLISVLSLVLDVSDRVRLEQERDRSLKHEQAAREAAERANHLKDEFLAVLSHELRSPLNPILGWTKLLRSGKLSPLKTTEALATIERNAKLQSQLIEDLLDISRIMRGKLALNLVPVNLPLVILAAIDTVRLSAEAKSIEIATHLEPNIRKVSGDAGRLQQVVWNLLSNAVKFTPTAGRIEVRLTSVNHHIQLQVIDTGKGIVSEFLPHVFEHFRQEDGATTRKFGGLGLGLAIARQIVELHGGRIWVESAGENQGATFTVELPALQTVNLTEAEVDQPILIPAETLPLANLRVLVVDDEPDSRHFVAFVVEQAGAEVIQVDSAIAALQTLARISIDILLSDVGMPDMNGYSLIRQIRESSGEQNQHIPAIALTAYAGEVDQQQAMEAGFQYHLAKPVEATEIVTLVARLCGRQGEDAE